MIITATLHEMIDPRWTDECFCIIDVESWLVPFNRAFAEMSNKLQICYLS